MKLNQQRKVNMKVSFLLLLTLMVRTSWMLSLAPEISRNCLKPAYGINYKYTANLLHNLGRIWIVTKVPIPKWEDLYFEDVEYDCAHLNEEASRREDASEKDALWWSYLNCRANRARVDSIRAKGENLQRTIKRILTKDIYALLPDLKVEKPDESNVERQKRFPWVAAIGGLITVVTEAISIIKQRKRDKAIEKALQKFRMEKGEIVNRVEQFGDDFLMYGEYLLNTTEEVITRINLMTKHDTDLKSSVMGEAGLSMYANRPHGLQRMLMYSVHLEAYLHELEDKHVTIVLNLLRRLIRLLGGLTKLCRGLLPEEIFSYSMMSDIVTTAIKAIQRDHPEYTLALTSISHYYDMKLVTFHVDPQDHSLIISFPILLKEYNQNFLSLYEIETVHVPVEDLNSQADSYTRVEIQKPYIAVTHNYYIQLRIQELRMCKLIQQSYYCEELFLVKHKSKYSCESALFFELSASIVREHCTFQYYFNKTVMPSILDGGPQVLLANFQQNKKLICKRFHGLATPLPEHAYVVVNRTMLCDCEVESELTYLKRNLACNSVVKEVSFFFTINMGFTINCGVYCSVPTLEYTPNPKTSTQFTLPIYLNKSGMLLITTNDGPVERPVDLSTYSSSPDFEDSESADSKPSTYVLQDPEALALTGSGSSYSIRLKEIISSIWPRAQISDYSSGIYEQLLDSMDLHLQVPLSQTSILQLTSLLNDKNSYDEPFRTSLSPGIKHMLDRFLVLNSPDSTEFSNRSKRELPEVLSLPEFIQPTPLAPEISKYQLHSSKPLAYPVSARKYFATLKYNTEKFRHQNSHSLEGANPTFLPSEFWFTSWEAHLFTFIAAISVGLSVIVLVSIILKLRKIRVALASGATLGGLPGASAGNIGSQLTETQKKDLTIDSLTNQQCNNIHACEFITVVIMVLCVLIVVWYSYRNCKNLTLCYGEQYEQPVKIYLFLKRGGRYIGLKLRSMPAHMNFFENKGRLHSQSIMLEQNCGYDIKYFDWEGVELQYANTKVPLPCSIIISLKNKQRIRNWVKNEGYVTYIMCSQGDYWFNMNTSKRTDYVDFGENTNSSETETHYEPMEFTEGDPSVVENQ